MSKDITEKNIGIGVTLQVVYMELLRMVVRYLCHFQNLQYGMVKILPWYSCHHHCCMYGTGENTGLALVSHYNSAARKSCNYVADKNVGLTLVPFS